MFSPYEPWGKAFDAPVRSPSPEPSELLALRAGVAFAAFLEPAALADLRRAEDGMDESEGVETWPAPAGHVCDAIDSPLSTPPSSPEASPADLPEHAFAPASAGVLANPPPRPTPAPASAVPISARKLKQREGKKARQARNRQEEVRNPLWAKVKPALSRLWQKPQACKAAFSVSMLPGTEGGFIGQCQRRKPHDRSTAWTLQELKDRGFRLVEWDGKSPYVIVDKDGHIFVLLCGRPRDKGWDGVNSRFANALYEAKDKVGSKGCQRRGCFANASTGVTLGQGAVVCALAA